MIPTIKQAKHLWDSYHLPDKKRIHVQLVSDVALYLANKLLEKDSSLSINLALLQVAGLLHDIDKSVPKLAGEHHPESAVRILRKEGMDEVADVIKYHSVYFIGDSTTAPHTWEEKCLYLADKMVKYEILTVDKRFELWLAEEDLPEKEKGMLRSVYPRVKQLEKEIFSEIGIQPENMAQLVRKEKEGV